MNKKIFEEIEKAIKNDQEDRENYQAQYGYINRPVATNIDGRIYMRLEDGIYELSETSDYNFVNAIHDHALHFFGNDFLDEEDKKELNSRHPAIQWMQKHINAINSCGNNDRIDGNGASWFRFAYDLFTMRDNSKLEKELKRKLLSQKDFQSARYELKVAAICATAGFDLRFEDESDASKKHPEFIGIDRFSGVEIAVEAKSRHRPGVLGFEKSGRISDRPMVGVRRNILDAYEKYAKLPYFIFIDPNLPSNTNQIMEEWDAELDRMFEDLESEGYEDPCPANAVLITNDPSHYVGDNEIDLDSDGLWVRCYLANKPATPHPRQNIVERLLLAHKQRVSSPVEFYENP